MTNNQAHFFINTAGFHLGCNIDENHWQNSIENINFLTEFLNKSDILFVYAFLDKNEEQKLKFDNKIKLSSNNAEKVIIFYKISPVIITEENYSVVQTVTIQGSPNTALYHALNNVFIPLLNQGDSVTTNAFIQKNLNNLQTGLRNLANISDKNSHQETENNILTVIQNLEQEVEFWKNKVDTSTNKTERNKFLDVLKILQQLWDNFGILDALQLPEIEDVLEAANNNLDDLWRVELPYPKARMQHLMELMSFELIKCLSKHVTECKVWSENYNTVSEVLGYCINIGEHWINICKQLTEIYWPNYSLHVWSGKAYVPENLEAFILRIKEVLNVRTIHRQIVRLLTASEVEDLKTNATLKHFEDVDYLLISPCSLAQWKVAIRKFEQLLQPAEQRVAEKLRKQISDTTANTQQLLHECSRYCELISRPTLKQILQNERQYLLSASKDHLKDLKNQMTSEVRPDIDKYNTSQTIGEIINLRQFEHKVKKIESVSNKLLNDLPGFNDFIQDISNLLASIKDQHTDLFDSWTNDVFTKIKSNQLSLKENEPVVQFSKDKMMKVNYSPRFFTLITEVRLLSSFGYLIPDSIIQLADLANKFMKYARILEQISNFHNTIGDKMIPSQRPMMLTSAVNLSKLVQEQEVVTWNDIKSVEKYVEVIKNAVEKLSEENDFLTDHHNKIMEKIADLEYVDIIKQFQKWKDALKFIQNIVDQVHIKGFKNMEAWKTDIDKQLAIVLEKRYLQSFDTLHLYLPEIQVDLAYRNSELQFLPPTEILIKKYNTQLKRFMDLPRKLTGVSDNSGKIFADIVERNSYHLDTINMHRDQLFEQLQTVKNHWKSWLTMENIDTSNLKKWQQWDIQFRACKTFGQEIAKLPSTEEKIGCFVVGLSWLRIDLENFNRNHWSQLTMTLKDSIAQDIFRLQQYIDSSTENLTKQFLTKEQIGEANLGFTNILNEKPEMEILLQEVTQKRKTLSIWTREEVDAINRIQAAWDRLEALLEDHEHIVARQIETMKITLNINSENLLNDLNRFEAKWEFFKFQPTAENDLKDIQSYYEKLKEKRLQWKELKDKKTNLINEFLLLNVEPPVYAVFDEIENDIEKQEKVWKPFEEFYTELNEFMNEEWILFRKKIYRLEEFLSKWENELKKSVNPSALLQMEIEKYNAVTPVLQYLRGDYFTEKHWTEIFNLLEIQKKSVDELSLGDFLNVSKRIVEEESYLQTISKRAASEIVVRQALSELEQWEFQTRFSFIYHLDSREITLPLIKDFKDILNKVGDNHSLIQSVKNSSDYETFSERIISWEGRLSDLDRCVTLLAQVQRKWLYLEPIFGSGTLGQEKARFGKIDKDFRRICAFLEKDSKVTSLLKFPNVTDTLENLQDQLSKCQHSLDNFLSEKRKKFPRFFFLSDDNLLEIIGQSSKELVIQSHLKKLFGGINSINLDKEGKNITAICSLQGEIVNLNQPVDISLPIEDWLNNLVKEMQSTLKNLLMRCLSDGDSADPSKYPSQILCLANSIAFTKQCEKAISNLTLVPLLASYKNQLIQYSSVDFKKSKNQNINNVIIENSHDNSNILKLKLKALLMDTIHHISVIEALIAENVTKENAWRWQKELRFYSDSSGNVTVKIVNAKFEYSYEYLGNQPKLVRTSLTDKCFLTLTQGMHFGMGGNPYGPAGTGKTESVKALGCLLGRQILVFNCDETIDATSMGMILFGLVCCGAWGCFDEFNRLDESTLSAVSMHIQRIQNALYHKQSTLTMLNQEVQVNKHSGIFVTLNPAGGGYSARNKLPDNLKQLFRPIVMTHPDHEDIAKTLLHCDGFKYADVISKKIVEVYKLARNLLSSQQHYDWGLRALKTVLLSCGDNFREHTEKFEMAIFNLENELEFAVRSLRRNTLSRLTYNDSRKFEALIKDIFPNTKTDYDAQEELINALKNSCTDLGYYINARQIQKCVEFFEQLKQRMGVALVGPAGSGKTIVRTLVFHALNKMGLCLKQKVFNPKSMSKTMLLGQIDSDTRQWIDGVLTLCSLQVTSESSDTWSWIICDGDVDPEWIESLNSVLDDNRLLSLPSGWQIKFGPNVNFVFETDNLSHASPATISRLGIVFLNEEDFDIGHYVNHIVSKNIDCYNDLSKQFVSDYFFKVLDIIQGDETLTIPRSKLSLLKSALWHVKETCNKGQFLVGMLNGFGGHLTKSYKEEFCKRLFELVGEISNPSILNYYDDVTNRIETYEANTDISFSEKHLEIVSLVKTAAVNHMLEVLRKCLKIGQEKHFLLVGEHGSAKTLIIEELTKERSDCEMITIHCSAHVTPQYLLYKLSQVCVMITKSNKKTYKPNKGNLILYFKNLQLLQNDQWGTNILTTFIQQLINYRGFYDFNLEWVEVENFVIVGSSTPTQNFSKRFSSLFHVYYIESPSKDDLLLIYQTYMNFATEIYLKKYQQQKKKLNISKLVNVMLSIFYEIQNLFNSPDQLLLNYTTHDLTKWFGNIWNYKYNNKKDVESFLLEVIFNEARIILRERLKNENDKLKYDNIVKENLKSQWGIPDFLDESNQKYFIPIRQSTNDPKPNFLLGIEENEWKETVLKGIRQYENEEKVLDICITSEILFLTSIICKALSKPKGNIILVGPIGTGRKSSARIVSAIQCAKLICPITANKSTLCSDLKMGIQLAGVENQTVYFLIEDFIFENSEVLNIISVLIQSGEVFKVPGLFLPAEIQSITSGLKDDSDNSSFDGNILQYFAQRVQNNLHFIICLDIKNKTLKKIVQHYPALLWNSTLIWIPKWSMETMTNLPNILIDRFNETKMTNSQFPKVENINYFYDIHSIDENKKKAPFVYVTFIKKYIEMFSQKIEDILRHQKKLQGGISKLEEAKNVVRDLKVKASQQQEILSEKQAKATAALDMISNTMKGANDQKKEMEVLRQHTEEESVKLAKRKKEIEEELAEVKPLIEEARKAVGNIKSESLSEIRSLRAPPDVIRDILEGVLRLMGTQDTSWNSMKTFLSKRGVKEDIRSFDASRIAVENRQAVEKLMTLKKDSFNPKLAKRASVAAAPLAAWVSANVRFSKVLENIQPLEREQYKLQKNLENAEFQLEDLSSGLTTVDATVAKLKEQLVTYTREAAETEISLNSAHETLNNAEGLVNKLTFEYERWQEQIKKLSRDIIYLPPYCLLASAFVVYLGECSENDRQICEEILLSYIFGNI